jgi:hypothetical protein
VTTSAAAYLASLPEVETARLPRGTLFVANGLIYQVIEAGTGGFAKARQWRRDESTDVALIPGSFLTKYLPLVKTGRLLPVYRSRIELTDAGQTRCFVFPTEMLALDAAYFDVALIMSAGAYVRNHNHEPAFAVTDGVHIFRLYYYMRSVHGRPTTIASNVVEHPHCELRPHTEGALYWRLLPSWQESLPALKETQPMMAVRPPAQAPASVPESPSSAVVEAPQVEDDEDPTRPARSAQG